MYVQFDVPILFIIFNRPETTQAVFDEIKKIKPKKLYIIADGPRDSKAGEREKCEAARKVIEQVDWDCEVHKNYSEANLGCKKRVSSGIDWFFENINEGIILEDDCVPDRSFFFFCRSLLEHYKDNERVMMISGDNFQFGRIRGDGSYYFSRLSHIWGWATWRRAWKKYDVDMADFPEFKKNNSIAKIFESQKIQKIYLKKLEDIFNNKIDTWDYQWSYAVWKNDGLCIIPNYNLVRNVGFGLDATHTKTLNRLANIDAGSIDRIVHLKSMVADKEADDYYNRNLKFFNRVVNKVLSLIKYI